MKETGGLYPQEDRRPQLDKRRCEYDLHCARAGAIRRRSAEFTWRYQKQVVLLQS